MISTAFIYAFVNSYLFVITLMPDSEGLNPLIDTSIQFLVESLLPWDYFWPVGVTLWTLGIFLAWEFVVYSWIGLRSIIRFFRGV